MSKNNAKGLTTLRQRLKKYNKDLEDEIKVFLSAELWLTDNLSDMFCVTR